MLRLVTWWKNSYRKVCLLPLIASSNNNPRVICANNASNQSCRIYSREICRIRETVNLIEGVYIKNCGRLTPDNDIMSYDMGCSSWKDENWYRKIPLLLFISLLLRLHQTVREQLKNAYLLTKLLSRVTDNCRKTTSSLLRKYTSLQTLSIPKCEVFWKWNSKKTVSFEEQMMSMDKFTSIFFRRVEVIGVYYP